MPAKNGVPRLVHTSSQKTANLGRIPQPLPRFDNSLRWLTEFRKVLCLWLSVYYKGYNSKRATWKWCIEQDMQRWERRRRACRDSMLSAGALRSQHLHVSPSRSPPSLVAQEFLIKGSCHRYDWSNHWPLVTELNLQPLSSLEVGGGEGWNSQRLITCLCLVPWWFLWSWAPILKISRDPLWVNSLA